MQPPPAKFAWRDKFRLRNPPSQIRFASPPSFAFLRYNPPGIFLTSPPTRAAQEPSRLKRQDDGYERAAAPNFRRPDALQYPGAALHSKQPKYWRHKTRPHVPEEMKQPFRIFTDPEGAGFRGNSKYYSHFSVRIPNFRCRPPGPLLSFMMLRTDF